LDKFEKHISVILVSYLYLFLERFVAHRELHLLVNGSLAPRDHRRVVLLESERLSVVDVLVVEKRVKLLGENVENLSFYIFGNQDVELSLIYVLVVELLLLPHFLKTAYLVRGVDCLEIGMHVFQVYVVIYVFLLYVEQGDLVVCRKILVFYVLVIYARIARVLHYFVVQVLIDYLLANVEIILVLQSVDALSVDNLEETPRLLLIPKEREEISVEFCWPFRSLARLRYVLIRVNHRLHLLFFYCLRYFYLTPEELLHLIVEFCQLFSLLRILVNSNGAAQQLKEVLLFSAYVVQLKIAVELLILKNVKTQIFFFFLLQILYLYMIIILEELSCLKVELQLWNGV